MVTGNGNNRHVTLTWNDNSINETSFLVQRTSDGTTWSDVGTVVAPLNQANVHQTRTLTDSTSSPTAAYLYRVVALNTVGYGAEFPSLSAKSMSATLGVNAPVAPTNLTATLQAGPRVSLTWRDNATNESGFVVERATNGGAFAPIATPPARANTGTVTMTDNSVSPGNTYDYRVRAVNVAGTSVPSNAVTVPVLAPGQPAITTGTAVRAGSNERATLTWGDVSNETSLRRPVEHIEHLCDGLRPVGGPARQHHHLHDGKHQPAGLVLQGARRERRSDGGLGTVHGGCGAVTRL